MNHYQRGRGYGPPQQNVNSPSNYKTGDTIQIIGNLFLVIATSLQAIVENQKQEQEVQQQNQQLYNQINFLQQQQIEQMKLLKEIAKQLQDHNITIQKIK